LRRVWRCAIAGIAERSEETGVRRKEEEKEEKKNEAFEDACGTKTGRRHKFSLFWKIYGRKTAALPA
jgi:hypothetical protein